MTAYQPAQCPRCNGGLDAGGHCRDCNLTWRH